MAHEDLVRKAKDAITAVFGDTTVDRQTTHDSLKDLQEELDTLIDSVEKD